MGRPDDLISAVKEGDMVALQRLLNKIQSAGKSKIGGSKKLNINQLDSKGLSALHHAVQQNNMEATTLLIDAGANVDIVDEKGIRPLYLAAGADKLDAVRLLLARNSKVNEPTFEGSTPLHVASEHGHLDTVNELLSHKADPTLHNFNHKTALDLACEFGSDQIVERLIASGLCHTQLTEVLPLHEAEKRRATCLHLAARNGQIGVIRQLMRAGFDVNSCSMNGTALHEAVAYSQAEAVSLLLDLNIDAGVLNGQRLTAYDVMKQRVTLVGQEKICKRLKDATKRPVLARAIRSYSNPQDTTHLAFNQGDIITVTERHQSGMWKGFVCGSGGGGNSLHHPYPLHLAASPQTQPRIFPSTEVERVVSTGLRQGSSSPYPGADWSSRQRDVTYSSNHNNNNGHHGDCSHVTHEANPYSVTVGVDQSFPLPPSPIGKSRTFTSDSSGDSGIDLRLTSSPQAASPLQPASCPFPRPQKLTPTSLGPAHLQADNSCDWSHHESAANHSVAAATTTNHHHHHQHHHRSASPMFNKSNSSPTGSNRSSTASSSGSGSSSSGYLGSSGQVNNGVGVLPSPGVLSVGGPHTPHQYQPGPAAHRPHDQSLTSSASRLSYTSHGSLEDQQGLGHTGDHLQASGGRPGPHSPAPGSCAAHFSELYHQGKYKDAEIIYAWLTELQLIDWYQHFMQAGYDMPTISRMTPEDLTAIGITNPGIRKKLTSEISRLRICDGIPNYRPNTVLEWLQLLKLEQYYDVLMNEGYTTFNHILDIAWEDLEEIGFRKLGHQKKIILAIDRLKKLTSRRISAQDQTLDDSAHRTSSNHNVSLYSGGSPHPNAAVLRVDPNTRSDRDSATPRLSQPSINTPTRLSKSSSGDSIHALSRPGNSVKPVEVNTAPPVHDGIEHRRPSSAQPEVVAIQLRREPLPRGGLTSSNDDLKAGDQLLTYESFHGDPSNDFNSLLAGDVEYNRSGDMTPTNDTGSLSADEMDGNIGRASVVRLRAQGSNDVEGVRSPAIRPQVAPRPDVRGRRASGDSARFGSTSSSSAMSSCGTPTATITSGYGSLKRRVSCRETTSVSGREATAGLGREITAGTGREATSVTTDRVQSDCHTPKISCRVVPVVQQTAELRGSSSQANGPTTPSHGVIQTGEGLKNAQNIAGGKKAPPPPPKRTNSVKEDVRQQNVSQTATPSNTSTPELIFTNSSNNLDMTFGASDLDKSTLDQVIERLQWSGDQSIRPTKHKDRRFMHSSSPTPPHVTSGVDLRETSATLGRHPAGSTSLNRSDSNCSSCSGDSNTLPFANENVGTIRQKFAAAAGEGQGSFGRGGLGGGTASSGGSCNTSNSSSQGSRNSDNTQKGPEMKKTPKPVPAQKPQTSRISQSTPVYNGAVEDVFSDIDSMLHGLTQELDDMLISKD